MTLDPIALALESLRADMPGEAIVRLAARLREGLDQSIDHEVRVTLALRCYRRQVQRPARVGIEAEDLIR